MKPTVEHTGVYVDVEVLDRVWAVKQVLKRELLLVSVYGPQHDPFGRDGMPLTGWKVKAVELEEGSEVYWEASTKNGRYIDTTYRVLDYYTVKKY